MIPYYTQHPTQIALRVRERKMSFSGDDFTIKDAVSGAVMFKVDGSAMSLRDNKSECCRRLWKERWGLCSSWVMAMFARGVAVLSGAKE